MNRKGAATLPHQQLWNERRTVSNSHQMTGLVLQMSARVYTSKTPTMKGETPRPVPLTIHSSLDSFRTISSLYHASFPIELASAIFVAASAKKRNAYTYKK